MFVFVVYMDGDLDVFMDTPVVERDRHKAATDALMAPRVHVPMTCYVCEVYDSKGIFSFVSTIGKVALSGTSQRRTTEGGGTTHVLRVRYGDAMYTGEVASGSSVTLERCDA